MTKNELIEKLQSIPGNPNVALLNLTENEGSADNEEAADGIYENFSVDYMTSEDIPEGAVPWIAISYNINPDKDGK